jgi:hypothetical protein
MKTDNQLELSRRNRDTGSGIAIELLSTRTLNFIFSPYAKHKILKEYAGIVHKEEEYFVSWELDELGRHLGVGRKGSSNELVFLCTAGNNGGIIDRALETYMVTESLSQSDIGAEYFNNVREEMISFVGPNIMMGTCNAYKASTSDSFIDDHIKFKRKRLSSPTSIETNQTKIIALSYYIGTKDTYEEKASHPNSTPDHVARAIEENQNATGPFSWIRILSDIAGI